VLVDVADNQAWASGPLFFFFFFFFSFSVTPGARGCAKRCGGIKEGPFFFFLPPLLRGGDSGSLGAGHGPRLSGEGYWEVRFFFPFFFFFSLTFPRSRAVDRDGL